MYTPNQEKKLIDQTQTLLLVLEKNTKHTPQNNQLEKHTSILYNIIRYHEYKYAGQNNPVITDYQYDLLFQHLKYLEKKYPVLQQNPNSPTQRPSSDLNNTSDSSAVPHLAPMLSLDNSYNAQDLFDFDQRVKKLAKIEPNQNLQYIVEPKYDGGSIALVYKNGILTRGATRGNGTLGEEITHVLPVIQGIPQFAAFKQYNINTVEIRGEVLIPKNLFIEINNQRQKKNLPPFANPRNAATGGLRVKNIQDAADRQLHAFLYQVGFAIDQDDQDQSLQFETQDKTINSLEQLGFAVPKTERKVCHNIQEAIDFCLLWAKKRQSFPYEIDGMVVKVNSFNIQKTLGFTAHHPRWAIAFKFKAKQAISTLQKVNYQVGKVGNITPVAKIKPVQLAGVTVSSISLHNEDFINSKDIRLGDKVLVERAGDVIPYIVKSIPESRIGKEQRIQFPSFCPINTTDTPVKLIRENSGSSWNCPKCLCGVQDIQRMIWHVSKDAMDIDGLGASQIKKFYDLGYINDAADIYNLDFSKIVALEGYGQKSIQNLEENIEKSKQNPIHRLLHSLSIHHLGKKASKLIASQINHVLDLKNWQEEDFTHIKDIGPVVAQAVITFFKDAENIDMLQRMNSYGVNMKQTHLDIPKATNSDGPFAGKSILFTGKLLKMDRKVAQEKALSAGARLISAVSSKLNILVVGEKAGSKLKKAQALGSVEIITESEFIDRISNS